jgi:NifB/MoaA-like Fe-S oxidoreductase
MKRNIVETLTRLTEKGITVHTQAVIVPGKNDGDRLRETIETLGALNENILSLAVVPVGLTKHREGLTELRTFTPDEMNGVLDLVESYREKYLAGPRGSRFVFPSDEWYLGAGRDIPEFNSYEGFPQLDNGVGMVRELLGGIEDDLEVYGRPANLNRLRIVTGKLGHKVFTRHVFPFLQEAGVADLPDLVEVENNFFGTTVTVSGLLVAEDMLSAVKESAGPEGTGDKITMIPGNCVNHNGLTIDGMDLKTMSATLGETVVTAGESFIESMHACVGGEG